MSHGEGAAAAQRHTRLLQSLVSKLRDRNAEILPFKDVFISHQGLLHINEKLRQQTLQQDKVRHRTIAGERPSHHIELCSLAPSIWFHCRLCTTRSLLKMKTAHSVGRTGAENLRTLQLATGRQGSASWTRELFVSTGRAFSSKHTQAPCSRVFSLFCGGC